MFNKEDFFTDLGMFIKDEANLDWEDTGYYLDIIDQYPNYTNYMIGELAHYNMKYIQPENNGWKVTNGSVVIGEYRIELCCYGTFAINLYKNEELLEMLVFNELVDVNKQLDTINAEITSLLVKKEKLQNKLKQMA